MDIVSAKDLKRTMVATLDTGKVRSSPELMDIVKVRLAVGYLGERDQGAWWPSTWLSPTAPSFLSPIYGDKLAIAQYGGIVETARRVHDERIGIGRVFHLFRLSEALERRLHETVASENESNALPGFVAADDAEALLAQLAAPAAKIDAGPIRVGDIKDLDRWDWISELAGRYQAAFEKSEQTFPYFSVSE